jgi:cytoskeletal protein RodZ
MAEGKKTGARSKSSRSEKGSSRSEEKKARAKAEEKQAKHASDLDAMGQDKRRQVVGHSYGPTRRNQAIFFAAVAVVVVVVLGGWTLAVAAFDTAPENYPDKAPWSTAAELSPTRSPSGPCGEPGNPYPPPADSPCAAPTSAKTTEREPTSPGSASGRQEEGPGGGVSGSSESQAAPN